MDALLEFAGDEDNTFVLVGACTAVAAVVVGGILVTTQTEEETTGADAVAAQLTLSHSKGRAKKKPKGSKAVRPQKQKSAPEPKSRWADDDEEEEEEEQQLEQPPAQTKGKKGKKGKGGKDPADDEWATVPKKDKRKAKPAAGGGSGSGKVTMDLGDAKPAVIGKKGAVIQDIQATSGASIDMADRPSTKCTITGTPEQVSAAVTLINGIVGNKSTGSGSSDTISVGARVGAVIGKGGSNIKMIQTESGAKVDVSRDTNEVTISGEPSQIAKAKELIASILEGGPIGPPPEAEKVIETKSAGAVIGRGGATIRKIQEESGARVDISKDSSGPDVITISGSHAAVEKAAAMVDGVLNPTYDCKDFMDVGIRGVPLVVGPKGATIQALQNSTGAKIDIESGASVVGMFGTDAAVKACRDAIQKMLTENLYEEEMHVPAGSIGTIIGRAGENIRKVQADSGARVSVVRDDSSVKVGGSKEQVKKARQLIEALLADVKTPTLEKGHVIETIDLPSYAIGSIIGKAGATIKALQAESGATLDIKRGEGSDGDACKIYGPKESVAAALDKVKAILETQKELQEKKGKAEKSGGEGKPSPAPPPQEETWGDDGAKGDW